MKDVLRIKKFIEDIYSIHGEVPYLIKATNNLELAIKTGENLAKAADEASKALKEVTSDLYKVCTGDPDEITICQAGIDRKWQKHAVNFTLSWENNRSVVRYFIRNIICGLTPESITKRLDYCSRD